MRVYPKRILIVLHGSIGDMTRALPLASLIRKGFPDVKLSWAVEAPCFPWWSTIQRSMKSLSSIGDIGARDLALPADDPEKEVRCRC
jgi:hypothetical protein